MIGLYAANQVDDDDIAFYADEARDQPLMTWHGLRLQSERPVVDGADGQKVRRPNRCLSDFVAPRGVADFAGMFAVSIHGAEAKAKQFEADLDDYGAIMIKSIADRLAEAFAERLHQRVRTEFWAYAPHEALSNEQLIAEQYRGIRPAPGYPACPDHTVKRALFETLAADEIGMGLTEHLAMTPAAAVSGFYIGHPQAAYFNVGKIGTDQLEDWARRNALALEDARRALAPAL